MHTARTLQLGTQLSKERPPDSYRSGTQPERPFGVCSLHPWLLCIVLPLHILTGTAS